MFFPNIFLLTNIFLFCKSKNIILPFRKISIENFNGNKTINDLINYNIYVNISMGTPPQIVAHFIEQGEFAYHFRTKLLSYDNKKISGYHNLSNFWYNSKKSSTFIKNESEGYYSDVFYFNTKNNTKIEVVNLRYNIYLTDIRDKYKCGIIGLNPISNTNFKFNNIHINFFQELKSKELISELSFTILYENINNSFNYENNLNFGSIIIGESPHVFNPEKFNKENIIANNENGWSILVNELNFNSPKDNYTEKNIEMQFSFITGFIKGSASYRREIDKIFFSEFVKNKLCEVELLKEYLFRNKYYVYSCVNNEEMNENIKSFPTLNFEVKTKNLTFFFTYNELFKVYNNKLYFMIIFRDEKYSSYVPRWIMGEIFLRKYLTTYNYDSKTFIFYRNQVDEMNIKTRVFYNPTKPKNNLNVFKYGRTFIEIIMAFLIIIILYLLYRKYRNTRKLHANELEDSNYVYVSGENNKSILTKKERELNKIIN